MDIREFTKRISRPAEKARNAVGFIKHAADDESTLLFSPGFGCERWIKVPTAWVEEADHLGEHTCGDHAHHVARLRFKGVLSEDAAVAVELLTHTNFPTSGMEGLRSLGGLEGLEKFPGLEGPFGEIPDFPPLDWLVKDPLVYGLEKIRKFHGAFCASMKIRCLLSGTSPLICNGICP